MMINQSIESVRQKIALMDSLPVESEQWTMTAHETLEAWLKLDKTQQSKIILELFSALLETGQAEILAAMEDFNGLNEALKKIESQPLAIKHLNQIDLRLRILQVLYRQSGYMTNQEVLLPMLREQGQAISHNRLYVELEWLRVAEVLVYQISDKTHVATLTNKGLDVVQGVLIVPDIRRPLPDEMP